MINKICNSKILRALYITKILADMFLCQKKKLCYSESLNFKPISFLIVNGLTQA